jgi:threonine dehydrogenase-like Zn-dependent dehydrogenase
VVNGLANTRIDPGIHVVVIGTGYMGLLKIQGLVKSLAGQITAFDIDDRRLALAKKFGADRAFRPDSEMGQREIQNIIGNGGANVVIECSGSQAGFELANSLMRQGGILSMFAWHRALRTFNGTDWHVNGYSIINTAPNFDVHFEDHIEQAEILIRKGVFYQDDLITHAFHYHHAQEILEIAANKQDGYIKGAILFQNL